MSMPYGQGIQYLQSLQGTVGYFSINCAVSSRNSLSSSVRGTSERISADVILKMFHVRHTTQHRQHQFR